MIGSLHPNYTLLGSRHPNNYPLLGLLVGSRHPNNDPLLGCRYNWKKRTRKRETRRDIFMDKSLLTIVVLFFISHPTVARRVFYLFTCKKLGSKW